MYNGMMERASQEILLIKKMVQFHRRSHYAGMTKSSGAQYTLLNYRRFCLKMEKMVWCALNENLSRCCSFCYGACLCL